MGASQLVNMIKQLPLGEKLFIMELIVKDIREETMMEANETQQRKAAAELLLTDYQNDAELTAFKCALYLKKE